MRSLRCQLTNLISSRVTGTLLAVGLSVGSPASPSRAATNPAPVPAYAQTIMDQWAHSSPAYDGKNSCRTVTYTDAQKTAQRSAGGSVITAVAAAVKNKTAALTIAAGVYRFPAGIVPLNLNNATSLSIHAGGVEFIMEGTQSLLLGNYSSDVTIDGLTFDRDPLPYSQFTVLGYDSVAKTLKIQFMPCYLAQDLTNRIVHLYTPDGNWTATAVGFSGYSMLDSVQGIAQLTGVYGAASAYVAGNVGAASGSPYAIVAQNSTRLSLTNVTDYATGELMYTTGYGPIVLTNVKDVRRPGTNRLIAGGVGGLTFSGGGLRMSGSEFAHSFDDILDILGSRNHLLVSQEAPNVVVYQPFYGSVNVGDVFRFFDLVNYNQVAYAVVTQVVNDSDPACITTAQALAKADRWNGTNGRECLRLTLDRNVTVKPGDYIENYTSYRPTDVSITNNFFHDFHTRVLIHGVNGAVIANNLISNAGYGLHVSNELYWGEGANSTNVTIRNNVLKNDTRYDMLGANGNKGTAAIFVGVVDNGPAPSTDYQFYRVAIDSNYIVDTNYAAITVKNTSALYITGNTIDNPVKSKDTLTSTTYFGDPQSDAIFLFSVANIQISGNQFYNLGPNVTYPIRRTRSGAPNLALKKPATASNTYANNTASLGPAFAVDANAKTAWATDAGCAVSCWMTIDLGAGVTFNSIYIQETKLGIQAFQIQYWTGSAWATAYSGTSAKNMVSFPAVTSTQVRLNISKALSPPAILEFSVYNIPAGGVTQSTAMVP